MKIPFVLALLLAGMMAHADATQTQLTVAVYDFTATSEMDLGQRVTNWNASLWNARRETTRDLGPNVTALVTTDLAMETNLVMVERAELDKALNEQAFGVSGLVSADAAAKIGAITGAKVLVAGQVIKTGNNVIIVADIIGTETSRLFADKVQGAADNLSELTSDLSRKIAQTITDQTTNLVMAANESSAERLDRIIKNINGTNRPSISVNILWPNGKGHCVTAEGEFGGILLKAGFPVVDANSDRKPDVEITGVADTSRATRQDNLFSGRSVIELKIQERRTGDIIIFDHQESIATDATRSTANTSAQVNAVDALAERVLPLLAK
jgi:TolB-like protein